MGRGSVRTTFEIPTGIRDVGAKDNSVEELLGSFVAFVQAELEGESFEHGAEERRSGSSTGAVENEYSQGA